MRKTWIIPLGLIMMTMYTTTLAGAMFEKYGFTFSSLIFLISHPPALISGIPFAFWLIFILGSHEMGHYLACRKYRVHATLPFFLPAPTIFGTAGAVIRIRGIIPDRKALFDIGVAGPLAGFLASLPPLLIGMSRSSLSTTPLLEGVVLFGDSPLTLIMNYLFFAKVNVILDVPSVFYAGWAGLLATTMNLFPVGQLDGGHICYALSNRFHRMISYVTIFGMAGLVFFSLLTERFSVWLLWLIILTLMGARHPRLLNEERKLSKGRRVLFVVIMIIFILSFMIDPISIR